MVISMVIGAVLGFLSGLGVGGGSLLVLWLTLVMNMDPQTARSVNLLFFLPSAVISCYLRRKQGSLDLKRILPAVISGSLAAALFAWISTDLDTSALKKGFGILLLVAGIRELFYRPRKAR